MYANVYTTRGLGIVDVISNLGCMHCPMLYSLLRGLRNLISSSTHSSVVRGHIEFRALGFSTSRDKKSVRLKSH